MRPESVLTLSIKSVITCRHMLLLLCMQNLILNLLSSLSVPSPNLPLLHHAARRQTWMEEWDGTPAPCGDEENNRTVEERSKKQE
ncbi:hypothetical protein MHYP_G00181480 [Metynnis hypsauchen]